MVSMISFSDVIKTAGILRSIWKLSLEFTLSVQTSTVRALQQLELTWETQPVNHIENHLMIECSRNICVIIMIMELSNHSNQ